MSKIGLKVWSSNNLSYLKEAKRLFKENCFDFIELYVVPETLPALKDWQILQEECNIPFVLHAPHFAHNVNLANPKKEDFNIYIYNQVKEFSKHLNPDYIVVHSGMNGDIKETVRQLRIIKLDKMIIENKPYFAPVAEKNFCRGANIEEIKFVMENIDCGFCLDASHALCAANSFKTEPYEFLAEFNELNPTCYHLCDGKITSEVDCHLNFGKGDYDIAKILSIFDKDKNIAVETRKSSKENLNDFKDDVMFLKGVIHAK